MSDDKFNKKVDIANILEKKSNDKLIRRIMDPEIRIRSNEIKDIMKVIKSLENIERNY